MSKVQNGSSDFFDSGEILSTETIEQYKTLVKKIARHLLGRLSAAFQVEDLIQAGMIGLLEAIKNYDSTKGASFETYASIRIRGSMLDEVRRADWVPRSVHRNARRTAKAVRLVENEMGRDAKDHEVANSLEMTLDEYHQLLQESHHTRVFTLSDMGEEGSFYEDLSSEALGPLEKLHQDHFKETLSKEIEHLPERERLVLSLYYDKELNLREIGEVLGVSESRISQIHSQTMSKLQGRLKDWRSELPTAH